MLGNYLNNLNLIDFLVSFFKANPEQNSLGHESTLFIWRKRIFNTIFICSLLVGSFSYFINVQIAVTTGRWLSAAVYTLGCAVMITIVFVQRIPFNIRAWLGIFIFYGVGLTSLLALGPVGSGRMFLFAFALLATLLLGKRAGMLALAINIGTLLIVNWMLKTGYVQWLHVSEHALAKWPVTSYNFFLLNTVITASVGVLVAALEKNLLKEQSLSRDLKESNVKLERENAERRLAQESLRKSRERYKTLTNNIHVGIYRNTDGPDGKFLSANPAMLEIFGFESKDEFFKIKVSDLYQNTGDRQEFNKMMIRRGSVSNEERHLRKKDGTPIICSVSAVAIKDENGRILHYDGVIEDVTERRQLESQIQQSEKMNALGLLAGGVAHDLNNILSSIVSYPGLILMDLPEDSDLKEPMLAMQDSGIKAAAIVQDLLTMTRRGVTNAQAVNLNDVIGDYFKSLEFKKLKSFHPSVQIKIRLASEQLNVMGSPVHLSKTIMNLVSNAAEAIDTSGEIIIKTEYEYLDRPVTGYEYVEAGAYVVLTVSDSGVGMAPEELNRIFEPFYTKKVMGRSGTGLGMAVVWGTVQDHLGYIHVASKPDEGTIFKLYFPMTDVEVSANQKSIELNDILGHGESVLVVDDIKEQRQLASKILTRLGYQVNAVSSGEAAIEYLREEAVDLILLDMIMDPGMDGLETFEQVVTLHPGQKAIIASGFSETDRVLKAQQLGAGQYVRKPYSIDTIGLAARAELSKKKIAA